MSVLTVSALGKAQVIVDIVPKGNFEIRPAYPMKPTQIAIHNTGNSGRGANAKAHNIYIHNMAELPSSATGYASWHFSVDDKFIYQHIPLNESAWHTGDGSALTSGNRTAIGIEICENVDMENYPQAEENAIALAVHLMKMFSIGIDKVKPHQAFSGKYCPRVILGRDGSFTKFHNRIKNAYAIATQPPVETFTKYPAKNYTVQSGDTLSEIGQAYGVTVEEIKQLNNLTSDIIYVGQVLMIRPAYRIGVVTGDVWLHSKPDTTVATRIRVLQAGEQYRAYGYSANWYLLGASYVDKDYFKLI